MNTLMNEKIMPVIMKFINSKPVLALKDGFVYAMPLMIAGSIFLLLAEFPIKQVTDFFASVGLKEVLNQAYACSFNIMALIAVIGIAYTYADNEGYAPLPAGAIALSSFLLLQPGDIVSQTGEQVSVILKAWCAGQGMVCAIIIGNLVGFIYCLLIKKGITIKMPNGVPAGIVNSFNALIPAVVITFLMTALYAILQLGFDTTFFELIYGTIQTPLQGLSDSLWGIIAVAFLVPLLWWFGVHGASIVTCLLYTSTSIRVYHISFLECLDHENYWGICYACLLIEDEPMQNVRKPRICSCLLYTSFVGEYVLYSVHQ